MYCYRSTVIYSKYTFSIHKLAEISTKPIHMKLAHGNHPITEEPSLPFQSDLSNNHKIHEYENIYHTLM
jgi:hypothetical protein